MAKVKPPCRPSCPRRCPGCHNPDTCRDWRDYCAQKAEQDTVVHTALAEERLMDNYRVGILRDFNRRRNSRRNGRTL